MVDEGFVTVGLIMGSRIYGCSSESGGEVRVMGWWQQVVNATGWVAQFLKEITTQFVTSLGKRRKVSIVKCCPIGHRRCNGINNAQYTSHDMLLRNDVPVEDVVDNTSHLGGQITPKTSIFGDVNTEYR